MTQAGLVAYTYPSLKDGSVANATPHGFELMYGSTQGKEFSFPSCDDSDSTVSEHL